MPVYPGALRVARHPPESAYVPEEADERKRKSLLSGRPRRSYNHSFIAGRDNANLVPRPSVRLANASQELPTDGSNGRFVGDWNRRQFRYFQCSRCAAIASAALSPSGPVGRGVAAFSRNRNPARLAISGPVHRHPERESFLRADGAGTEPDLRVDGPRAAGANFWSAYAVQPFGDARRKASAWPFAAAGGGQARQTGCGSSKRASLETPVQFRSRDRREDHRAQRQPVHRSGRIAA